MNANEKWYDEEIAPLLRDLAAACQERDMAFLAIVEFSPEVRGSTAYLPTAASLQMRLLDALDRSQGNLDAFLISVARYCREHKVDTSHSLVMQRLLAPPVT